MPKDPSSASSTSCAGFDPETGKPCTCPKHKSPKDSRGLGRDGSCRCGHKKSLHKGRPLDKKGTTVDSIFNGILDGQPGLRVQLAKFRAAQDETNDGLKNKAGSSSGKGQSGKETKVCVHAICSQTTPDGLQIPKPKPTRNIKVSAVVVLPSHLDVSIIHNAVDTHQS